jgi:sugar phosphate permease
MVLRFGARSRLLEAGLLTSAYVLSQFFRSFLAVIAPEFTSDLDVTRIQLGALSSTFFVTFAVAQIPAGLALDRFGAGRTVGWMLILGAHGAATFGLATNLKTAVLGEVALGLACAPVFMGLLHYIARHYLPEQFISVSGLASAIGLAGSLLSSGPLGWFSSLFGWRAALFTSSAATFLIGVMILMLVHDPTVSGTERKETPAELFGNIGFILRLRKLWPIIPMCFVSSGVAQTFRAVWSGPYLDSVFQVSQQMRATTLLLISLGTFGASFFAAALGKWLQPREATLTFAMISVATLILLAAVPAADLWLATALLTCLGFFGSVHTFLMAHGKHFLPSNLIGRGLGLLNTFVFLGIGMINAATGWIIDLGASRFGSGPPAYSVAFASLAAMLAVGLFFYRLSTSARQPASGRLTVESRSGPVGPSGNASQP